MKRYTLYQLLKGGKLNNLPLLLSCYRVAAEYP